jgi:hypothetical protein
MFPVDPGDVLPQASKAVKDLLFRLGSPMAIEDLQQSGQYQKHGRSK